MPRFRNAPIGSLKAKFNSYHGQARVKIEDAFGMLKRKFQSLRKGLEEELVDDDVDEGENEVNADRQADDGYPVGEVDQNINNDRVNETEENKD